MTGNTSTCNQDTLELEIKIFFGNLEPTYSVIIARKKSEGMRGNHCRGSRDGVLLLLNKEGFEEEPNKVSKGVTKRGKFCKAADDGTNTP